MAYCIAHIIFSFFLRFIERFSEQFVDMKCLNLTEQKKIMHLNSGCGV